jgi:hypothetical protein
MTPDHWLKNMHVCILTNELTPHLGRMLGLMQCNPGMEDPRSGENVT